MEENRFTEIDRWLTRTLRHGLRGLFASVDELHRQATDQQFGKQELLWVANNARKRIRRGQIIYRFEVERTETGIFVSLNEESEDAHQATRQLINSRGVSDAEWLHKVNDAMDQLLSAQGPQELKKRAWI